MQNASDPKHFQRRNSEPAGTSFPLSMLQKHCVYEAIHSGVVHLKGPAVEDLTATAQKTDARNQW